MSLGELWRPIKTDSRCSLRMEFRMNWSAETEKAVVGKARAGDLSAFGLLYDNYSQNVYSRCLRFTKDPDSAEDLRQDVFIQAWKKISHFRGDSRFGTWLHRVTTNMIFMHSARRSATILKKTRSAAESRTNGSLRNWSHQAHRSSITACCSGRPFRSFVLDIAPY